MRPLVAVCLALALGRASAADLGKVERATTKEPAYAAKPLYCLLVFGPEAKERVWLVIAGDVAHIDRNGDGDLTAAGERFALPAYSPRHFPRQERTLDVGALRVGGRSLGTLQVSLLRPHPDFKPTTKEERDILAMHQGLPERTAITMTLSDLPPVPRGGKPFAPRVIQMAGADRDGYLRFAAKASEAPIVHFDGPLRLGLLDPNQSLVLGKEGTELRAAVGTPGLGKGSSAWLNYARPDGDAIVDVIPETAHPEVEASLPRKGGGEPVMVKWTLKQRC